MYEVSESILFQDLRTFVPRISIIEDWAVLHPYKCILGSFKHRFNVNDHVDQPFH